MITTYTLKQILYDTRTVTVTWFSSSLSFTPLSPTLTMFFTPLSFSPFSPLPHLVHSSSASPPWLFRLLLLPFLQCTSLKYEITDEFHDEPWHLGAETELMRGNYQDAELANGLLLSFVFSWSRCTPPTACRGCAGNGSTASVGHKWTCVFIMLVCHVLGP